MPLSLGQVAVKAIVDWNVEWRKDGDKEREFPRNPIRRGMIVRVDGDPQDERLDGLWVTFGDDIGKDKVQVGDVEVRCIKVQPRELNLAFDCQTKIAAEAWKRTFNVPDHVGTVFQSRTAKGRKIPVVDKLQLTGAASQGPIADGPGAMKEKDED